MTILQSKGIMRARDHDISRVKLKKKYKTAKAKLVSMGNKSNNLRIMKDKIPSWINLPESICLPFQMMEYTLKHCDPKGDARIHKLIRRLS